MTPLNSLLILGAALLVVFVESTFDGMRNLVGVQVDLLPSLMVYSSLTYRLPTLAILAFGGGLCFDAMSANPLGISILPLFLCGFAIHLYRGLILRDQPFAQITLGAGATAASTLLTLLLLLTSEKQPMLSWVFLWQLAIVTLVGAAVTPFWFAIFDRIGRAINYRPSGEITFRSDRQIKRSRKL